MKRVLIIAYYFPPIGGIGSIRLSGFASHLPEFGWSPTIIAPESTPHARDPSLCFAEQRVVRTKSLEPAMVLRRLVPASKAHSDSTTANSGAGRQPKRSALRTALVRLAFPDAQLGWYPGAVAAGLRLVREQSFDAIYSSAYPVTSHLIAATIAGRAKLSWVAEFRDPWSERVAGRVNRLAAEQLERGIARRARRVVVVSQTLADYHGARWGVDVAAIPNGHDLSDAQLGHIQGARNGSGPPILSHVGSYYPGRQSLRTVWRAVAGLKAAGRRAPTIRWVGSLAPEARDELASCGLLDTVQVAGVVSHDEALRLMSESSMLIASGELDTGPLGRGTTAAKLFEYIASDLPVLYVSDPRADAARMLGEYEGCYVVDFGDEAAARRAIEAGVGHGPCKRNVEGLSRRDRTEELARVLTSALAGERSTEKAP